MMQLVILVLFVLLSIGDAWTTWRALRLPGFYEASPIGRYLIGTSLMRMLALKAVLVGLFAYALFGHAAEAWVNVLRWAVVAGLLGLSIYAVANNAWQLRSAGK